MKQALRNNRYSSPPGLSEIELAARNLRAPAVFVLPPAPRKEDPKNADKEEIRKLQAKLKRVERTSSARLAKLERSFDGLVKLAQSRDRVEAVTRQDPEIVITSGYVHITNGIDLTSYAKVKLPLFQRLKRWAMGQ